MRGIQKPLEESPHFESFNIPFLVKGTKKVIFISLQWLWRMSHTLQSILLAKIDLVSLYFHLLWYHSILRGSIDQKHAKTNKIWRQNSEIHPAFACSHWPPWFPDCSRPYGACMKCGKYMFGLVRVGSQISPCWAKKDSKIPPPHPRENKISQMPYPRANKDNQIPPAGITLIGALQTCKET